jgi:hypothetical protein
MPPINSAEISVDCIMTFPIARARGTRRNFAHHIGTSCRHAIAKTD